MTTEECLVSPAETITTEEGGRACPEHKRPFGAELGKALAQEASASAHSRT